MNKISYSAVVLDEESHRKLLSTVRSFIPKGWKEFGHHCTICLGPLPEDWRSRLGENVTLYGFKIGIDDKAMALEIDNFKRILPGKTHITIAVNWENGGRPKDSNFIQNWDTELKSLLKLTGTIEEVPFN